MAARVLVVDQEDTLGGVQVLLQAEGIETTGARTVLEALSSLECSPEPFHAVILNFHMPSLEGRGLMHEMRRHGYGSVPVLLLFACGGDGDPGASVLITRDDLEELVSELDRLARSGSA